jgi:hypothetical protein
LRFLDTAKQPWLGSFLLSAGSIDMHCTKDNVVQVDGTALEGHVCDRIVTIRSTLTCKGGVLCRTGYLMVREMRLYCPQRLLQGAILVANGCTAMQPMPNVYLDRVPTLADNIDQ